MAQGTHFRPDADLADVAWKLVAVNLSDLAAKGAQPVGVLLSYSLGDDDDRFLAGLDLVLREYDVPLMGGDTIAATGARTLGLTAIGRAVHRPVPTRSGAQAGDAIYVTGMFGRAMLGFEGAPQHAQAFNRPHPLLEEGQTLAPFVTAMMDVSDGLLLDLWRIANASALTFQIDTALIPVADPRRVDECIRWGDDYQLLFTAPAQMHIPVPATRIGTVHNSSTSPLLVDGAAITGAAGLGYQHG